MKALCEMHSMRVMKDTCEQELSGYGAEMNMLVCFSFVFIVKDNLMRTQTGFLKYVRFELTKEMYRHCAVGLHRISYQME